MAFVFDGLNKRILLDGTLMVSVRDMYSRWIEWSASNLQFLPAFTIIADPPRVPVYATLVNGWKIKPAAGAYTLTVEDGFLYDGAGGDPFVASGGVEPRIVYKDPVIAVGYDSTGAASAPTTAQIAAAIRAELAAELASIAEINARLPSDPADQSAVEDAIALIPGGGTGGGLTPAQDALLTQIGLDVASIPTASENADAVRTNLTTELARIDVPTSSRLDANGVTPNAAPNVGPWDATVDVGTVTAGTYADTVTLGGVRHTVMAAAGKLDFYYNFTVSPNGDGVPTGVKFTGALTSASSTVSVHAWNWINDAYDLIGTLKGTASSENVVRTFDLRAEHAGTGINTGEVCIQFFGDGLPATTLYVDQVSAYYAQVPDNAARGAVGPQRNTLSAVAFATPFSLTVDVGTLDYGTVDTIRLSNDDPAVITPIGGIIDVQSSAEITTSGDGVPVGIKITGALNDFSNVLLVSAWNWQTGEYDQIGTMQGSVKGENKIYAYDLLPAHVGPAENVGEVNVRLYGDNLVAATTLYIDQILTAYVLAPRNAAISAIDTRLPAAPAAVGSAMTLAAGAVTAASIASNAITAAKIATGAITAAKFAASAIDATAIASGAITSAKFAAGAIDATAIAASAITSAKFAASAITASAIATGAITNTKFAAGAVDAAAIATGAITAGKFANGAITSTVIAAGAITSTQAPNLDATVSSRSTLDADGVWGYATRTITSGGITLGEIEASTVLAKEATVAALPTAAATAAAVRSELTAELARLDAAVSSRSSLTAAQVWSYITRELTSVASSGLTPAQDALLTQIGLGVATLPADPASQSVILAAIPSDVANAAAVWGHATRTITSGGITLGEIEASTVLAKEATVAARATQASVDALPTAASTAAAVRSELTAELTRLDAAVSSRSTLTAAQVWAYATRELTSGAGLTPAQDAVLTQIALDTANLPADPASQSVILAAIPTDADTAAAVWGHATRTITSGGITLGEIEASTVLAKEATVAAGPAAVWSYGVRALTVAAGLSPAQDATLTAINAKTANLPAMPAARGDIPSAAQSAEAVLSAAYEGSETVRSYLRYSRSVLVGRNRGTKAFPAWESLDGSKVRVAAPISAAGVRAAPTILDPS